MWKAIVCVGFLIVMMLSGCGSGQDLDGDGYVNCAEVVHDWPRHDDADCYGDAGITKDGLNVMPYDGFNPAVHDCDDNDSAIHPDAPEVCDGLDNDCDGIWDEGGDANDLDLDCDDDGFVKLGFDDGSDDCNPWDAAVYPGAPELIDGRDNDCDGECLADECSDEPGSDCPCRGTVLVVPTGDVGCQCNSGIASHQPVWLLALLIVGLRRRSNSNLFEGGLMKKTLLLLGLLLVSTLGGCGPAEAILGPQRMIDPSDADLDGHSPPADCDDANSSINPGATDVPADGIDQDCDGQDASVEGDTDTDADTDSDTDADTDTDATGDTGTPPIETGDTGDTGSVIIGSEDIDDDGDGFTENQGDCNDANVQIGPTQSEVCDSVDQDCDGQIDEGLTFLEYCTDADLDGYGDSDDSLSACAQPADRILNCEDCDDANAETYPGTAPNEPSPALCYKDDDGDNWGDSYSGTVPAGVTLGNDCHDGDATVHPGAPDILYDAVDQDCDGYAWCDGDGDLVDSVDCAAGGTDCDDTDPSVSPNETEVEYNGVDDDCDPATLDQPLVDPLCVSVTAVVTGTVTLYVFETNTNDITYWVDPTTVPVVPNTVPFATGDAAQPICGDMALVPYSSGHTLLVLGTYVNGGEQSLVTGNSMIGYTSQVTAVTLSGTPLVCSSYYDPLAAPYAYTTCTLP